MSCCGVRMAPGRQHCAYCRRTLTAIRERRCVACLGTVCDGDSVRVEGLCVRCRMRAVSVSPSTRRLLHKAANVRHRQRRMVA
jgi:hypothetical protein